jgi:hypothetical protein
MAVMLYEFPEEPWQTGELPVTAPAADGKRLTVIDFVLGVPFPQELIPYTESVPDVAEVEKLMVGDTVVPSVIVAPVPE